MQAEPKVSATGEGATQHRQLGFQPSVIMSSRTFYQVVIIGLSYSVSCVPDRFLVQFEGQEYTCLYVFSVETDMGMG